MAKPRDLIRVSHKHDGSVEFNANAPYELQRRIQEGDPGTGWEGDIFLGLFNDKRPGRVPWWVYEARPNQRPTMIYGTDTLDDHILVKLREMRSNARDLMKTVGRAEAHDAKVEQERQARQNEHWHETLDRIAHTVRKEHLA